MKRRIRVNRDALKGAMSRKLQKFARRKGEHYTSTSRRIEGRYKITLDDLNDFADFLDRDVMDFIILDEIDEEGD